VIYVNAGATRPADAWLDALAEGGLILPPTDSGFPNRDDRPADDCWLRGAGWCLAYR
jgi:hypothetical protein